MELSKSEVEDVVGALQYLMHEDRLNPEEAALLAKCQNYLATR